VIFKKLYKVNNRPTGRKCAQSGHPENYLKFFFYIKQYSRLMRSSIIISFRKKRRRPTRRLWGWPPIPACLPDRTRAGRTWVRRAALPVSGQWFESDRGSGCWATGRRERRKSWMKIGKEISFRNLGSCHRLLWDSSNWWFLNYFFDKKFGILTQYTTWDRCYDF
jgi:hypothetical protein